MDTKEETIIDSDSYENAIANFDLSLFDIEKTSVNNEVIDSVIPPNKMSTLVRRIQIIEQHLGFF